MSTLCLFSAHDIAEAMDDFFEKKLSIIDDQKKGLEGTVDSLCVAPDVPNPTHHKPIITTNYFAGVKSQVFANIR